MILPTVCCRACSPACSLQAPAATYHAVVLSTQLRPSFFTTIRTNLVRQQLRRDFHSTSKRFAGSSTSSRISYRVAVASSGKGRRFHPLKNAYNFDPNVSEVIGVTKDKNAAIRRKNRPDSGEDAFFVSLVGTGGDPSNAVNTGAVAFAVADGVGGWTESRVDPADFSHGLCGYMAESALAWDAPAEKLRPKELLQTGYDQLVADPTVKAGGSTASVGVALPDGSVELANLGDSGSVLLRLAAVHHYSAPQTHGFNTPYQLSIIPPRMRAQASVFGGAFLEDFPRDAAVTTVRMQHGDVLVLATDGVFDNLNNQDILKLVTSRMILTGAWAATPEQGVRVTDNLAALAVPGGISAALPRPSDSKEHQNKESDRLASTLTLQSLLAASIAGEAKIASVDFRRDGPFAKEAQRYYPGDHYRGGKVDDICALVIVAVDEGLGSSSRSD